MAAVASLLAMGRTTCTASLKSLRRRPLIKVTADLRDRRDRLMTLTAKEGACCTFQSEKVRTLELWHFFTMSIRIGSTDT